MRTITSRFLLPIVGMLTSLQAAEPIHLASHPSLSPDGSTILFSWQGDIWTASSEGGKAQRITTHPAEDFKPLFTPDGKSVCFNSTRAGGYQVFIQSIKGGSAKQITHHSEGSILEDVAPDGSSLLVRGLRDFPGRAPYRFFKVAIDGKGSESLVFNAGGKNGRYASDGQSLVFTREGSPTYRKGYQGTQASQVWTWSSTEGFQQPVSSDRGCSSPFYHPDRSKLFYTQGHADGFNLWSYEFESQKKSQITHFKDDSVKSPQIAQNGSKLVFRHLFDLYTIDLAAPADQPAEPQKLKLWHSEDLDITQHQDRIVKKTSDISFSPSGLEIVFSAEGDIWAMDTILKKPHRLTDTEGYEKDLWFSHDGKSIYYLYDDGIETEIRRLVKTDKKQFWWEADDCQHSTIIASDKKPTGLTLGPKGKRMAYTTFPATLWISDLEGKKPIRMLESWDHPSLKWSPDGQWITYAVQNDNFNPDVFITKADGSIAPVNVSSHPNLDFNPVFSPNGRRLAFVGKHHGQEFDIFYVELFKKDDVTDPDGEMRERARKAMKNDPAYKDVAKEDAKQIVKKAIKNLTSSKKPNPKSGKNPDYDLDGIHKRVHRIALKGVTPTKLIWSHDSKNILFQMSKGKSLYSVKAQSGSKPTKLADVTGSPIKMDSKGKLYWISNSVPAVYYNKRNTSYPFSIYTSRDRTAWKRMVFRTAWKTMRDRFYDPSMNGRDWLAVREKYEQMAIAAPNSSSMDRIINMMLGELNASHMGYRGTPWPKPWKLQKQWKVETVHLGIRRDASHSGKGWKVHSVIPGSPADRQISKIEPGEIILEVGGEEVLASCALTDHLNLRPGEPVNLLVANAEGESRPVKIQPINYTKARSLAQIAKLETNAKEVDRLSGGKLGYIHVARMMWEEFEQFQQHLYLQGVGKDALVIDVRDNGGGFTTDHLLTALCQPNHAFTIPRNGGVGYPQDRTVYATWNKPIIVLCNQNSFSNAEIFAHAIRNLKRGKIVGVATAGGVISTGSIPILDAGTMRLPFRGWFSTFDGKDMELNGAQPHITIWNQPGELSRGKDVQLEKAVQTLLEESRQYKGLPKPHYRSQLQ